MAKLEEITGKALSGEWGADDETGNDIPVLRTTNFTNEGKIDFTKVVTRTIGKNVTNKLLRRGDILIEKSGGSDNQPVGRVVFYDGAEGKYLFNNFTGLLRVKDTFAWIPKYVFYALFAHYLRGGTRHYENRTTGIHNLQTERYVSEMEIPDKSLLEQKEIVSVLDKLYSLLYLRKQQLAKLDELVKARFVELFGSPILNSKKWNQEPFADCCEIITGNTPPREHKEYYGNTIEWIKSDNINKGNAYLTQAVEYLSDKGMLVGRTVEPGSILMTCIAGSLNSIGNVAIVNRKVAFNQQINAFVPKKFEPWFLYYLLELIRPILHNTTNQALKCILTKGNLLEVNAIVPPLELQKQFATFACQTDKTKQAVSRSLNKLGTLQAALMQHYFG